MKTQDTLNKDIHLTNPPHPDLLLETLHLFSQKLLENLHWRDSIPEILTELHHLIGATQTYLIEKHEQGWKIVGTHLPHFPQGTYLSKESNRFWMLTRFWLDIHAREQAIYYGDRHHFPELLEEFTQLNILSIAILPIKIKKIPWGILGLENSDSSFSWSTSELHFLNTFSNLLSLSIQRQKLAKQKKSQQKHFQTLSLNSIINSPPSKSIPINSLLQNSSVNQCCKNHIDCQSNLYLVKKINHLLPCITYIYDLLENKYTYLSPQIKNILGHSITDFQNTGYHLLTQLLHPEDQPKLREHYQQFLTLRENKVIEIEYRLQHIQGQWQWFWAREVIFNHQPNGCPQQILGIMQDITNRKQAEQALQKSQLRLSEAQRIAHLGNWEWDLVTGEQQWSDEIIRICGLSPQEIYFTYETFEQRLHPEDREMVLCALEQAITRRQPYQIDFRIVRQDHSVRYVHAFGEFIRGPGNKPLRLVGTAQDITKRKKMVDSLRSSEIRLKAIFDNAAVGIILTDHQTRQIQVNNKWIQMTDYSEENLINTYFSKLVHPEDVHLNATDYEQLAQGEILYLREEKRFVRKDSTVFWGDLSVTAIYSQTGKVQAYIIIVINITQHKQTETDLREAKEAAEVANRAKSAFLANMSHELRTPLNAILGYTQILKRDSSLTTAQQDGLSVIHRSGEYLLTLINDVLDLSKIEADRLELIPTDFYLESFLKNINELFQMRAEQKNISFHYQILTNLPKVIRADEIRLRQILINLLSNAIKFTQQGGVTFKISRHQEILRFQVEDTGIGIAANDLLKIFLPFSQVAERDYHSQGTGLGLAISKKLVELMGSHLYVESIVNRGTLFWMELKLPEVSQEPPMIFEPQDSLIIGYEMPTPHLKKPITILVVDDQWENRSVLVNLLSDLHFKIIEASHGQECLDKMSEVLPEVVLMDLVMPIMDGFEATRQIKKNFPQVIVIAISASAFDFHQAQSMAAGCDDFIAKPIHTEKLLDCLQQHLHLQWQFASHSLSTSKSLISQGMLENFTGKMPSPQQASVLFELAMRGNITGILDYLEQLEYGDQHLQPFTRKIQQLAYDLKDEQIANIVKQFIPLTY